MHLALVRKILVLFMAKYKKGWFSLESHVARKLLHEIEVHILQLF